MIKGRANPNTVAGTRTAMRAVFGEKWESAEVEEGAVERFRKRARGRLSEGAVKTYAHRVLTAAAYQEAPGGAEMMEHSFPLRADVTARLSLPRDLTRSEAERLSGFVAALAADHPR